MLADDLALALEHTPGLSAAELAARVGTNLEKAVSEQAVSFALFADHHRFRCQRSGDAGAPRRWWLAGHPAMASRPEPWHRDRPAAGPALPAAVATRAPVAPAAAFGLYAWQSDALQAWAGAGRRGVVEAVTGTGKTRVGVAAAMAELAARGQVLVLVPTVELAHQWMAELRARLPDTSRVGQLGAGGTDSLAGHDVLVAVVNSARAIDVRPIRRGGLLVADECHRYGSDVNRRALTENVTARFTVTLVGVDFSPDEWADYRALTEQMRALRARLVRQLGLEDAPVEVVLPAVMRLADSDGEGAGAARGYRQAMLERRALLADTPAKDSVLAELAPAIGDADRAIVFTRSIAASERAALVLAQRGLRSAAVHSALARDDRSEVLGRFAAGALDVICAPRVLDEGVDVPAADLAVIAGASHSRRQMIQRMGRVLRRKPDGRRARFAVLFVEGTAEDPSHGAHQAFLDEIVPLADNVSSFPAGAIVDSSSGLSGPRAALRPSWPEGAAAMPGHAVVTDTD